MERNNTSMLRIVMKVLGLRSSDFPPGFPSLRAQLQQHGQPGLLRWLFLVVIRTVHHAANLARLVLVPDVMVRQTLAVALLQTVYELFKIARVLMARFIDGRTSRGRQAAALRAKLKAATTYAEYRGMRERLRKLDQSRTNPRAVGQYSAEEQDNCRRLKEKADVYRRLIDKRDTESLKFLLRSKLLRKHWGATSARAIRTKPRLYRALDEYLDVVCSALVHIAMAPPPAALLAGATERAEILEANIRSTQEKLSFFNETRHSFGRSALLLSGGARMGLQHVGVVKAMMEQRLLPRVISGSSAGSIVAAMLGCLTDDEVQRKLFHFHEINLRFFGRVDSVGSLAEVAQGAEEGRSYWSFRSLLLLLPPPLPQWLLLAAKLVPRWLSERTLLDSEVLGEAIRSITGDMTFQEAYDKTGRIINITVSPQDGQRDFPMLLNYLTAPQVVVWSAAVASSAIPGVFAPAVLLAKSRDGRIVPHSPEGMKWTDGSLENDLPMQRLAELFNINHFIVSQVNVHARILAPLKSSGAEARWRLMHGLEHLLQFLRDQVRSYVKHIANLGIQTPAFRALGRGLVPILTQKYLGDITIVPEFRVSDVTTLLNNPTKEEFRDSILAGERNTWPLLSSIRMSTMIELMLDDCVHTVRKRLTMMERKASFAALNHPRTALALDVEEAGMPENRAAYEEPKLVSDPNSLLHEQFGAAAPLGPHALPAAVPVKLNRVASYQAPGELGHPQTPEGRRAKEPFNARATGLASAQEQQPPMIRDATSRKNSEDPDDIVLRHCNSDLAQKLKDRTKSVVGLARLVRMGSTERLPKLYEEEEESS